MGGMFLRDISPMPQHDMNRFFTKEELAGFNGVQGFPILIACEGKVYDVTLSYHWRGGKHHALHQAGKDLTEELKSSPHGLDLLERFPVVGVIENDNLNS
jgi:predicted heme/steroid binding protein